MSRPACQNPERVDTGLPCGQPAVWLIGVGSRVMDRQLSCSDCLAFACAAMENAEGRTVTLTLIPVPRET